MFCMLLSEKWLNVVQTKQQPVAWRIYGRRDQSPLKYRKAEAWASETFSESPSD